MFINSVEVFVHNIKDSMCNMYIRSLNFWTVSFGAPTELSRAGQVCGLGLPECCGVCNRGQPVVDVG